MENSGIGGMGLTLVVVRPRVAQRHPKVVRDTGVATDNQTLSTKISRDREANFGAAAARQYPIRTGTQTQELSAT